METLKKVFRIIGVELPETLKKGQLQNSPRLDTIQLEYYLRNLQLENADLKSDKKSLLKENKDLKNGSKRKTAIIFILLAVIFTYVFHCFVQNTAYATLLGTMSSMFTILGASILSLFK